MATRLIPNAVLENLAENLPDRLFAVRYISVSGGYATLINYEGRFLAWFIENSRGVINIATE